MNYRGIVIEESLMDTSILDDRPIISKKVIGAGTDHEWHLDKVEIPEVDIERFVHIVSKTLKTGERWYAHFYHEDPKNDMLIVVFVGQIFITKKSNHQIAIDYGLSIGVPREQMDIVPTNIANEEW